ncbi:Hypothetical predicted protein [Cloeon dipterum]|uniref:Uncharacterized protein n=1 Tax=Cloeon dipterum TaxID=197152 RepID=A0A8S1CHE3_9INSE|nr:Hypothetical predicted protein [Cloeon dipterum]
MKILRYIHNMCDSDDKAVEFSLGELLEVDNKASAPTDPPDSFTEWRRPSPDVRKGLDFTPPCCQKW